MCTKDKKALIVERVMTDQLTKRLILMEAFYKKKIVALEDDIGLQTEKAMSFWRALLKIRRNAMEVL